MIRRTLIAALALLPSIAIAQANAYPAKPIRLIVPYPPAGPLDVAARALAEQVRPALGTIVVENKSGAGGNLGVDALAKSTPDGTTLGIGAVATHAINPWLFSKLPYDPIKDFVPITLIAQVPNVLVLSADTAAKLNINTVADLLAYLRKNPGKLNYASGGNGSGGHMSGELMKSMARVYAVHIPYAGASPAQLSLLSGQTEFMFDNLASAAPQIRAGKLKALAVTTVERAPSFKELPTMAEAGGKDLAGFDVSTWFGVFAPAGTPAPVVQKLTEEFHKALDSAPMRERLAQMGAAPAPTSSAEFQRFIAAELAKYRDVVKYSGAKVD